ncbi:MAG: 30S ribosomal protein S24e [Candidatus Bathyarchaeia archaeon]
MRDGNINKSAGFTMDVNIITETYNPLLKRKEVVFQIDHREVGSTPRRIEVKEALARILNRDPKLIFIRKIETKTGTRVSIGWANVYEDFEHAKLVEPDHIIKRNLPEEEKKEAG